MKRIINFCNQGDVQNPCSFRTVVPVYEDQTSLVSIPEYVKICTSKLPQQCCKVSMDVDFQTRDVLCGPCMEVCND